MNLKKFNKLTQHFRMRFQKIELRLLNMKKLSMVIIKDKVTLLSNYNDNFFFLINK